MSIDAGRYLSTKEVAEYLRLSVWTIYQLVHERRIPFRKIGSRTLFDREVIDAWVKSSKARRRRSSQARVVENSIEVSLPEKGPAPKR